MLIILLLPIVISWPISAARTGLQEDFFNLIGYNVIGQFVLVMVEWIEYTKVQNLCVQGG